MDAEANTMDLRMEYPEISALEAGLGMGRLDLPAIFPDRTGLGVKKHNQNRLKRLVLAAPLLTRMLWNNEIIEYAALGVFYSTAEMLQNGAWSQLANRTLILLTNFRLAFINIDGKGNPKRMNLHQVRFDKIKSVKAGWTGNLQLKLDSRTVLFQGVNKRDRAAVKQRLEQRFKDPARSFAPPAQAGAPDTGAFENLCTNCFRPVPRNTYVCPFCQTEYRTPGQAALRSIILPGWGDLYLKQGFLPVLRMALIPVIYIAIVIGAVSDPKVGIVGLIPAFIFFAFINGFSALVTYFVAKNGLVPLR